MLISRPFHSYSGGPDALSSEGSDEAKALIGTLENEVAQVEEAISDPLPPEMRHGDFNLAV